MGSFPSVKSREQMFFYGHPQNRFWRVIARIFDGEIPTTVAEKRLLLLSHGIALWDVISSCDIIGSSDGSIKNVTANDLSCILNNADIKHIYTNGATAGKYYAKYIQPTVGISSVTLPSTSPANASWSVDRLVKVWSVIRL